MTEHSVAEQTAVRNPSTMNLTAALLAERARRAGVPCWEGDPGVVLATAIRRAADEFCCQADDSRGAADPAFINRQPLETGFQRAIRRTWADLQTLRALGGYPSAWPASCAELALAISFAACGLEEVKWDTETWTEADSRS